MINDVGGEGLKMKGIQLFAKAVKISWVKKSMGHELL